MSHLNEKCSKLLGQKIRMNSELTSLSPRDFQAFTAALNRPFAPNAALKSAMTAAKKSEVFLTARLTHE